MSEPYHTQKKYGNEGGGLYWQRLLDKTKFVSVSFLTFKTRFFLKKHDRYNAFFIRIKVNEKEHKSLSDINQERLNMSDNYYYLHFCYNILI